MVFVERSHSYTELLDFLLPEYSDLTGLGVADLHDEYSEPYVADTFCDTTPSEQEQV